MLVTEAFPSNYLKADDLKGRRIKLTIDSYKMEDIGEDHKPVLYFAGKDKGLVLNKTNAMSIADAFGKQMDDWAGKQVEVFGDRTNYQGKMVDCIRISPVRATSTEPATDGDMPF